MYPRTNYEMTEKDLQEILDACKPVPVIMIGGTAGPSQQENANRAWQKLGERMGFDHMTVQPRSGLGNRFFSAVPNETEEARFEREAIEAEEKRKTAIVQTQNEIYVLQERLRELEDTSRTPAVKPDKDQDSPLADETK